jgi:aryl-alcohol dehydrogenase-like predicted oxidoreductase
MEYRLLGRTGVSVSPLRRLNTDYIDLYQMHRPSVTTDVEETLGALTDLVHQGKVRYIGSSSYSASQEDILPRAQRYGRGTLVYSPLSGGWLTGRWRKDAPGTPTSAARPSARFDMSTAANQRKLDVVEELALLAEQAGMTMIELALAWAINHPGVTSAIIGPRTMEQLESQLPSVHVTLDTEILDRIDELVAPGVTLNADDNSYGAAELTPQARRR